VTEGGSEHAWRPLADDFELYAGKWMADERILRAARRLEEELGPHPDLLDAVEEAIRADDRDALWSAMADFVKAVREAKSS
jgi:hypothetical protein